MYKQAVKAGRLEKVSFEAYNESRNLIKAVERYKARTGHYPERVLVDRIYRTMGNRSFSQIVYTIGYFFVDVLYHV